MKDNIATPIANYMDIHLRKVFKDVGDGDIDVEVFEVTWEEPDMYIISWDVDTAHGFFNLRHGFDNSPTAGFNKIWAETRDEFSLYLESELEGTKNRSHEYDPDIDEAVKSIAGFITKLFRTKTSELAQRAMQ